jgi:hypothetical protein
MSYSDAWKDYSEYSTGGDLKGSGLWLLMVLYHHFLGQVEENDQSLSQFRRSVEGDSKADVPKTNFFWYGTQNTSR